MIVSNIVSDSSKRLVRLKTLNKNVYNSSHRYEGELQKNLKDST